jgi:hypothetical protein
VLYGGALYVGTFDGDTDLETIEQVPLSGGDPVVLFSGISDGNTNLIPWGTPSLVANANGVYWWTGVGWIPVPTDGSQVTFPPAGAVVETTDPCGPDGPGAFIRPHATSSTSVFCSSALLTQPYSCIVSKQAIQGGATTTLWTSDISCMDLGVSNPAVDSTNVYFVTQANSNQGVTQVWSVPIDGGAPTLLGSGLPGGGEYSLAVDNDNIYWIAASSVFEMPKDGSTPPIALATAQASPSDIVATPSGLYWAGPANQNASLTRMVTDGGTPESVVDSGAGPSTAGIGSQALVPCPGGVCWTDNVNGALMRYVACSP